MSRYGVARPLSGWPSAVFSLLPPFAAPPLRGGWCPGWGVAPPGGLGLDTSPPAVPCERSKEGGKKQRDRRRPSNRAHRGGRTPLPPEEAQGGAPAPPHGAGRGSEAALHRQER